MSAYGGKIQLEVKELSSLWGAGAKPRKDSPKKAKLYFAPFIAKLSATKPPKQNKQ